MSDNGDLHGFTTNVPTFRQCREGMTGTENAPLSRRVVDAKLERAKACVEAFAVAGVEGSNDWNPTDSLLQLYLRCIWALCGNGLCI